MRPFDRNRQREALGGRHDVARIALGYRERRLDGEHGRLAADLDGLRLGERGEVRRDAAVADRRLGPRQLDGGFVDLLARPRRQPLPPPSAPPLPPPLRPPASPPPPP